MAAQPVSWLGPGERVLQVLHGAHLSETIIVQTQNGRSERQRTLISTPFLYLTDVQMVFVDRSGAPKYELIYNLPYLRTYLPVLKEWNEGAKSKIEQAQAGQGVLTKWFTTGVYRQKFGLKDYVRMIETVEHPRGFFGPKKWLTMTETTFRPTSAEHQQYLAFQASEAQGFWERRKLQSQARKLGRVFTTRKVRLRVRERASLDLVMGTLQPDLPAMQHYLMDSGGLQSDFAVPASELQDLASARALDK